MMSSILHLAHLVPHWVPPASLVVASWTTTMHSVVSVLVVVVWLGCTLAIWSPVVQAVIIVLHYLFI